MANANNLDNTKSAHGVYTNLRLMHVCTTIVGFTVHLQTKDGSVWEGIFNTFSEGFTVCLDLAVPIDPKLNSKDCLYQALKGGKQAKRQAFFDLKDIVRITVIDVDLNYATKEVDKITTDADISGFNSNKVGEHRQLETWQDDDGDNANEDSLLSLDEAAASNKNGSQNNSRGWDPQEMFSYNERVHKVNSTYDDELHDYTIALPRHCKNDRDWRKKQERAAAIAKEIECNPQSVGRLAKEDGSDNEEEKFSAVVRPTTNQQAQQPPTQVQSQAQQPPHQQQPQSQPHHQSPQQQLQQAQHQQPQHQQQQQHPQQPQHQQPQRQLPNRINNGNHKNIRPRYDRRIDSLKNFSKQLNIAPAPRQPHTQQNHMQGSPAISQNQPSPPQQPHQKSIKPTQQGPQNQQLHTSSQPQPQSQPQPLLQSQPQSQPQAQSQSQSQSQPQSQIQPQPQTQTQSQPQPPPQLKAQSQSQQSVQSRTLQQPQQTQSQQPMQTQMHTPIQTQQLHHQQLHQSQQHHPQQHQHQQQQNQQQQHHQQQHQQHMHHHHQQQQQQQHHQQQHQQHHHQQQQQQHQQQQQLQQQQQPLQQQQPQQQPKQQQPQQPQNPPQQQQQPQQPQHPPQQPQSTTAPAITTTTATSTIDTSAASERSDTGSSLSSSQTKDQSEIARKSTLNPNAKEFVYKPRSPASNQASQPNGANPSSVTATIDPANSSPMSQTAHGHYYQQVPIFPHGLSPHQQQHHAAQFMSNHPHMHFQSQIHYMPAPMAQHFPPQQMSPRYIRGNFQNYHHRSGEHMNNVRAVYSQAPMVATTSATGQQYAPPHSGAPPHPMGAYATASPQQPMIYSGHPHSVYPMVQAGFPQHMQHVPNPPPYDGSAVYMPPSQNYVVNP